MVGVALAVVSELGENRVAVKAEHVAPGGFWENGRAADIGQPSFTEEDGGGEGRFLARQNVAGGELLRYLAHVRAAAPPALPDSRPAFLDYAREA